MAHRASTFQRTIDAIRAKHALALLSAIESDRYINRLAQIVFQLERSPSQLVNSVDDTSVIAPMTLPPPTSPVSRGKRVTSIDATESFQSLSSPKRAKRCDEDSPLEPSPTQDVVDDITDLALRMNQRATRVESSPIPAEPTKSFSVAPLVLPDQIVNMVSAIEATMSATPAGAPSDICNAILEAGTALLQLPEHASTSHLDLLCKTLPLADLLDDTVLLLITKLLDAKWTGQDAAVVIEATLVARIQTATTAIPRSLLKALQAVASALPHVAIGTILVPILTSPHANAAQCEAMTRLVRDGLGPQQVPVIITRLLEAKILQSPHDRVLLVVQQIFNVKAQLSQEVIDQVVDSLVRAVADSPATTTVSVKFASVLFTLVTKHGPLCVRHRDTLLTIASKCTSSMAKTALRAIDKLA
ncbi:hypothetical protein H310_02004 [Aphanomyces invadans]|uniref:Fanconi Anaemia group E protein C-terminal domain-containing protein n=1 Tax=Aphanomyces invadans TaxID=157072 RepID=A0A024UMI4_9STRA|nr:hypothetical protein H310_02004 [Aphanomyces invadans]ETW07499.1 hypothetical protein H310_02004 [Aphanomyces invadans]|eukprot:XP_008863592.1 hypothetical protein H310_02004 [Aphanomyces invadans]